MQVIRGKAFTAPKAWGAIDVANMDGITTRLHWTDQPYIWHVNEGGSWTCTTAKTVQRRS